MKSQAIMCSVKDKILARWPRAEFVATLASPHIFVPAYRHGAMTDELECPFVVDGVRYTGRIQMESLKTGLGELTVTCEPIPL